MKVCPKCGVSQSDVQFFWNDGLLRGVAKRCLTCRSRRRSCPDCLALQSRPYDRRSKQRPRCGPCRALSLPPGVPKERYRIKRHAIARFHERARPDIPRYRECLWEMLRLMEGAEFTVEPPPWYSPVKPYEGMQTFQRGWLHVMPGVSFALSAYGKKGTLVATVMTDPAYVPPPATEPVPRWVVTIHEEEARSYVAAERNREAMRERARAHAAAEDFPSHTT